MVCPMMALAFCAILQGIGTVMVVRAFYARKPGNRLLTCGISLLLISALLFAVSIATWWADFSDLLDLIGA